MRRLPQTARFWIPRALAGAMGFACTLAAMSAGWHLLDALWHPCRRPGLQATRLHLLEVKQEAETFFVERHHCPESVHEVAYATNVNDPPRHSSWLNDAWGQRLLLVCIPTNEGPVIATLSVGPDGKFGTSDDLSSAELE